MKTHSIILASWISDGGLWIGELYFDLIKKTFPNSNIFIGINPCQSQQDWINVIEKHKSDGLNIQYDVAPDELVIPSDASAYQTALKLYNESKEKSDFVWFFHTQGTKRNVVNHKYRSKHNEYLFGKKDKWIEMLSSRPEFGLYGVYNNAMASIFSHDVPPNYTFPCKDPYVAFVLDKYYKKKFPCNCLEYFNSGTMFIIKGEILDGFFNDCDPSFFNAKLATPHEPNGDPYFFERDFIHLPDRFGYVRLCSLIGSRQDGAQNNIKQLYNVDRYQEELTMWIKKYRSDLSEEYRQKLIKEAMSIIEGIGW